MNKSVGIYINEKDKKRIEFLNKVYEVKVSELIRILIEKEYKTVKEYQELNI